MTIKLPTEEEEKELWRLSRYYWKEAKICEKAGSHLAGCVMLGSAFETLLILMVSAHADEVANLGAFPHKRGSNESKPLLSWTLAELLNAAKVANWLPYQLKQDEAFNARKALIGDYAEIVRKIRNFIHPSRYLKDHYRSRVTNKYLQRQFEIVLSCRDWLLHHNNAALMAHINAEERKDRGQ